MTQLMMELEVTKKVDQVTNGSGQFALYVEGMVRGQEEMVLLRDKVHYGSRYDVPTYSGKVVTFATYEEALEARSEHPLSVIVPVVDLTNL